MKKFYRIKFLDSSEALMHYGVKGMHWGEWNEETRERYGIRDDDGGLSKLQAFRETSYVLPAGSPVNRFTNSHEASTGTDLSRPFFASKTEYDYNVYADETRKGSLPTAKTYDDEGRITGWRDDAALIRMSATDDLTIARGKFVVGELFREDSIASPYGLREDPGMVYSDEVLTSPEVRSHFRKLGYDAIEDIIDQRATKISKSPIIVLNGDKMRVDSSTVYSRTEDQPPSWDDRFQHSTLPPEEVKRRRYAFPEQRKFPLTDRSHVLSAIKFFNYVSPKDEKHLANAILKRMRELGITEVNVGSGNRFGKYYASPSK